MTMAIRDMMHGNPKLVEAGWAEEALGFNAIAGGFQGQRQWTDQYPNADVAEALLNSSFDWNGLREPITLATENDSLNGVTMLFGHLLTNKAQIFADVRTYWSPDAVKRVTGHQLEGHAASGLLHLINSGAAALDGACTAKDAAGQPTMKPHWELTEADAAAALAATDWCPGVEEYFRGGGFRPLPHPRRRAVHHGPPEPGQGAGAGVAARRGLERRAAGGGAQDAGGAHRRELADHLVRPRLTGKGPFRDAYSVMAAWGANHGALAHGHVGADTFIEIASLLRIPVSMHNVDEAAIYRPSAWAAFGMDAEGQDYRACQTYGPLYG